MMASEEGALPVDIGQLAVRLRPQFSGQLGLVECLLQVLLVVLVYEFLHLLHQLLAYLMVLYLQFLKDKVNTMGFKYWLIPSYISNNISGLEVPNMILTL